MAYQACAGSSKVTARSLAPVRDGTAPPAGTDRPAESPFLSRYWPPVIDTQLVERAAGSARYTSAFAPVTGLHPKSLFTRTYTSKLLPGVTRVSVDTPLTSTGVPAGTRNRSGLSQNACVPKLMGRTPLSSSVERTKMRLEFEMQLAGPHEVEYRFDV